MKIVLTEEDVRKATVSYLISAGQLSGDGEYEVELNTYAKDFMVIEPIKPMYDKKEEK